MADMELASAFGAKGRAPNDEELLAALRGAYGAWQRLLSLLDSRIGDLVSVWGHAGKRYGWSLRVRKRKRVLVYLTPQAGQFLVSLALGEKAVAAARAARLPVAMLRVIEASPRYAEGRGVRFAIRSERQLDALARLVEIKSQN
jgi:hypothetical protein